MTQETDEIDATEVFMSTMQQKVEDALLTDKPLEVAKVQMELQWATLQFIQRIDWKFWELYTKYGN